MILVTVPWTALGNLWFNLVYFVINRLLPPCVGCKVAPVLNQAPCLKSIWEIEGLNPCIPDLAVRWR